MYGEYWRGGCLGWHGCILAWLPWEASPQHDVMWMWLYSRACCYLTAAFCPGDGQTIRVLIQLELRLCYWRETREVFFLWGKAVLGNNDSEKDSGGEGAPSVALQRWLFLFFYFAVWTEEHGIVQPVITQSAMVTRISHEGLEVY